MNSTDTCNFGNSDITTSQFSFPTIPSVFYEWAAILPLAIYLADQEQTHELVGKASLSDHIRTAPFPKLGVLTHIAQLLQEGADFLDRVSSLGGLRYEVWDTNWGSVFPCANGSASRIITGFAVRRAEVIKIPERVLSKEEATENFISPSSTSTNTSSSRTETSTGKANAVTKELQSQSSLSRSGTAEFRRYQTLHVLRFGRETDASADTRSNLQRLLGNVYDLALVLVLSIAAVASFVFGLYGSGVCLVVGIAVRVACRLIVLQRTKFYLRDNEEGKVDGCMLSAIHQNASTWYLYTGDRGVIDGLLNKPMILGLKSPGYSTRAAVPDTATATAFVYIIRLLSLLQLAAVTYATAQKAWDSVALLSFILFSMLLDVVWDGHPDSLARNWLQKHHIKVEARTFFFSGRVAMIGAIQVFKRNEQSSWMDGILQRNPRRDALLSGLYGSQETYRENLAVLDENEQRGVVRNVVLAQQAAELMQRQFTSV